MKPLMLALICCLMLLSCAAPQRIEQSLDRGEAPDGDTRSERQIHVDLVRGMIAQKQYYAALAHIQDLQREGVVNDELRVLEAQTRSAIGQTREAESIYLKLLNSSSGAAEAYQGLGLLYAGRGELDKANAYLRQAVLRRPTSVAMRNDLGYALMMAGRYKEALPELATAVELDPQGTRVTHNLVILLVLMRDEAGVRRVAAQAGLKAETLANLRKQAQALAIKPRPAVAAASRAG